MSPGGISCVIRGNQDTLSLSEHAVGVSVCVHPRSIMAKVKFTAPLAVADTCIEQKSCKGEVASRAAALKTVPACLCLLCEAIGSMVITMLF